MRCAATVFAMLLALLWQTSAFAWFGNPQKALADLEHAALHWAAEGHHHHDDGSYHVDESEESAVHVIGDHAGAPVVLPSAAPPALSRPDTAAFAPADMEAGPSPCLDGPLRPPRTIA
jgi:hypothetical protein